MQITLTGYADLISIHALREEGDEFIDFILEALSNFYPRPPRGGRQELTEKLTLTPDFYPRPPRGGRLKVPWYRSFFTVISIHALREEGDVDRAVVLRALAEFLSTPSARRATFQAGLFAVDHDISIHALREEGDLSGSGGQQSMANFYPRPPRGGRPRLVGCGYKRLAISIHALREEGDP